MAEPYDLLNPPSLGEQRLKLSRVLHDGQSTVPPARAFSPVDLQVDYSGCIPEGIVLPLELVVVAPSPSGFVRRTYRRVRPATVTFTPQEGGEHLVRIAEVGHARWWGSIVINVLGAELSPNQRI
ncbi:MULTISPECIES: hypothetical protein [Sorangium]|uniref:Uncharacterized protein n=1 Tax=Sorangium cellulosum TaxID=56 RepID=A0A4P2QQW5_SORCE|nr:MULTISPECIES: hypothetical protein [Sorangium]AUX31913.1 uncharacterized protein SOCE836_040480 [Sorangium cellulosum]WCQ91287.1 hypothetical protein NQZ70_04003 [Sorangium sp. Soce836]